MKCVINIQGPRRMNSNEADDPLTPTERHTVLFCSDTSLCLLEEPEHQPVQTFIIPRG